MTLYAVPTARGSATVACYGPTPKPADAVLNECERAAATLGVTDAKTYDLAADPGYGGRLRGVLARLATARTTLRTRLRRAAGRATQVSAALELARVTDHAADAARRLAVSARDREAHDELVEALAATSGGYERMAKAAGDGHTGRFANGARDVRSGDAAVRAALHALHRLSYRA